MPVIQGRGSSYFMKRRLCGKGRIETHGALPRIDSGAAYSGEEKQVDERMGCTGRMARLPNGRAEAAPTRDAVRRAPPARG